MSVEVKSTQEAHPWRATLRTVFAALIAFASMWAAIVQALGLDPGWTWVSASLAVTAGITRVLALPTTTEFLRRFAPWLLAAPPE